MHPLHLKASPHLLYSGSTGRFQTRHVAVKPLPRILRTGQLRKSTTGPSLRLRVSAHNHGKTDPFTKINGKSFKGNPVPVALDDGNASELKEDVFTRFKNFIWKNLDAFYRFSRPHTVIGTIIGITSISFLPVQSIWDLSPAFFLGLLKALVPAVLMNIYVVGLNQLFDIEIDKVNKPDLPLASGDFSMATGINIIFVVSLVSMAMGILFESPPLFFALTISMFLGTAYSVEHPLLRWKRHPVLAASAIMIVRALVVQLAFFIHMQKYVLGRPIAVKKPLVFATAFMCFFSVVIALFKDIPDVDGDKDFGIQSLSVKLGRENVFWLCVKMLLMAYTSAVLVGALSTSLPSRFITVLGHVVLGLSLVYQVPSVDLTSKASVTSFYMFIWKLFYAEYFLIPFVR
ncbi:hypothetical protein SLA2020_484770 [Shorea laevis]